MDRIDAHVWELVVRARQDDGYVVVWSERVPGSTLEIRGEGRVQIDAEALLASATPRDYGVRLGRAVFAGATLDAWQAARARGRERLHVVVEVEAPELRTLRWERLCGPLGEGWDFLRCDQRTPFTLRVASTSDRVYAPTSEPRALVLVTSPTDLADYELAHFDTLAMIAGVRAALAPWPVDVLAFGVPDAVGRPTLAGLCDALTAGRYAAIHVVCHGAYARSSGDTVLYLADDDELTAPTPATKLLRRVGRLGGEVGLPSLWFLGACETAAPEAEGALGGLGARLCRELGAPAVIAMADRVSVDTAMALVRPLYRQLRAHGHVDLALAEACSAGAERRDLVVPVLVARTAGEPLFPGTGPKGQVMPTPADEGRVLCETPLPAALGERFVGRAEVLAELRRRLAEGRPQAVALVGAAGFGKTRAALEFVWSARAEFPGGVFWICAESPTRVEATHHTLLRQLRPGTPALAELQAQGLRVAPLLAEAARTHRAGRQLWVLDHVPEAEPGTGGRSLAELCPRRGEVSVLMTSRMRPEEAEVAVIEVESLAEADAAELLTAGLPAGSVAATDAAAVVRWVGGMPLALELLARSLDVGDLSPAELVAMARTEAVVRALDETQSVLRQAGASAGLTALVETMQVSYTRLSPEAQALARRLAQFGPEPLPTELVKALGPVASRLARATLAGRSFVTGISGELFGSMHRVLADFLRGLAGAEEQAEAVAALLGLLPNAGVWIKPGDWPRLARLAVHGQALVMRCTSATGELVELGNRVGVLIGRQGRAREAEALQRHTLALAAVSLPPEDRRCVVAAANLGMTLLARGYLAEGKQLIAETAALAERVLGPDDRTTLAARSNLGFVLVMVEDRDAAVAVLTDLAERLTRVLGESSELLVGLANLAVALWRLPDLPRSQALLERALAGWRGLGDPDNTAALLCESALAQTLQMQGDLAGARARIDALLARARALLGPEDAVTIDAREKRASILRDQGELAAACAEQAAIVAVLTAQGGADDPLTLRSSLLLAVLMREMGDVAGSRAVFAGTLASARRFGAAHPLVGRLVTELTATLQMLGELAEAGALLAAELPRLRAALGEQHREYLELVLLHVSVRIDLGELALAGELLRGLVAALEGLPSTFNSLRLAAADALGRIYRDRGELAAARAVQERVLADSRALAVGAGDVLTRTFTLAQTVRALGDLPGARARFVESLVGMRQLFGGRDVRTMGAQVELALTLTDLGELASAEALLVPALAVLVAALPVDSTVVVIGRAVLFRVHMLGGSPSAAQAVMQALLPTVGPQHGKFADEVVAGADGLVDQLLAAGQHAQAVPLVRAIVETRTRTRAADDVDLLTYQVNLAALLCMSGGDRGEALALLDAVGERIAPAGPQHPLAAAVAHNRRRALAGVTSGT